MSENQIAPARRFSPDRRNEAIRNFNGAVCPGCAMSWGDCDLFRAVDTKALSDFDLGIIAAGRCPKRVNGTIVFSRSSGANTLDLSERAPPGAGPAMVVVIKAHWNQ